MRRAPTRCRLRACAPSRARTRPRPHSGTPARAVVEVTVEQDLERLHGLAIGTVHALQTGEHLTDVEGLRQERWILRARFTMRRSSSDNSSRPRMGDDVRRALGIAAGRPGPCGHVVVAVTDDLGASDVRRPTPEGRRRDRSPGTRSAGRARWVASRCVKVVKGAGSV